MQLSGKQITLLSTLQIQGPHIFRIFNGDSPISLLDVALGLFRFNVMLPRKERNFLHYKPRAKVKSA